MRQTDTRTAATADQDAPSVAADQDATATASTATRTAAAATGAAARLTRTAATATPTASVADLVALAGRAADRAARTYRLAALGVDTADVLADVVADALADDLPATVADRDALAAALGQRARSVADKYRRRATRETAVGVAADAASMRDQDATAISAAERRQRAAVLARVPRVLAADRSDVLAVGDWSREAMRSAETVALAAADRAALASALDAEYVPQTAAQRAAWRELTDQHDQDAATVAVLVAHLSDTRQIVAAVPAPTVAERAALAVAERETADVLAVAEAPLTATAPACWWTAPALARTAVLVASWSAVVPAARTAARKARETRDRLLAAGGRRARFAVDWNPVTVDAPRPPVTVADVLAAGYLAETLYDRRGDGFKRGDLKSPRRVSWSAVLPTSTETARVQVAKAARGWSADILGATRPAVAALPVALRDGHAPTCQTCADYGHQDGHGRYVLAAVAAGPRVAAARSGGAAGRAARQDGRRQQERARAADALAALAVAADLPRYVPAADLVGARAGTLAGATADQDGAEIRPTYGRSTFVAGAAGTVRTADLVAEMSAAALAERLADQSANVDAWISAERSADRVAAAAAERETRATRTAERAATRAERLARVAALAVPAADLVAAVR